MPDSGVRLTELLVSLSLATDLGLGQPPEHMVRAARLSMRLGQRLGLEPGDLSTLYDVSVLTYVGCPVYGNEAAALFGDDIDFRARAARIDQAGLPAIRFMIGSAGAGMSSLQRARRVTALMATGGADVVEQMAGHCSVAGVLANRLGLDEAVRAGVEQSYARWDGRGVPKDLAGEQLALSARISHLAEACEVFHRGGGIDGALDMVRARSGRHFDPQIAAAVQRDPESLFDGLDQNTVEEILEAEPVARPKLTDDGLDAALEAVGDFCDMRSPVFAGHSRGTAELVTLAAPLLNLSRAEVTLARRAALVHDVGRIGVPADILDKAGPLTSGEHERLRMHVYYVERIFSRPEPLRRVGLLAGAHHERVDGSGYHRGSGGHVLSASARLLAAADAFHGMRQDRPHRRAMNADDAARRLRTDAHEGRLDETVVEAVLEAAGMAGRRSAGTTTPGLTVREREVLHLLAQGLPNKGIARRLAISPKTAGNHVEHIYSKLGVSNRAGAAMRAMELGLGGGAFPGDD
jgi:HD-GYP domain-containing protein (c-di-GMP phosphodiesterase class II)